jgi:5-methyltetrahydrofolate--homocysteine methyltransferase
MENTYIGDWQKTLDRFEQWWDFRDMDKPLMRIVAAGKPGTSVPLEKPRDPSTLYIDTKRIVTGFRNYCETHYFLADAFPAMDLNLGPGSMALYLGGEPEFAWDTLWYHPYMDSPEKFNTIRYDEQNNWWVLHQKMLKEAVELARGDFYISIPDIVENLDILSAMRSPQNLCFDMLDDPVSVHTGVKKIDDLYFTYYDRIYDIVKDTDGTSSYTAFSVFGRGRVAKVQCDFCALISPDMFREYVEPSLRKQCQKLDHSIYHLDGPDAVKHVPALMEIKELDALQWTCGAGQPDGSCERWYPIYDQVRAAGKGLWIILYDGSPADWAKNVRDIVKRYGTKGIYFLFPEFPDLASAKKMAALFD